MAVETITNIDPALGETTLNCNPNLIHYKIPYSDPLWYDFRYAGIPGVYPGGIGASEIPKVMRAEAEQYRPVLPEMVEWKAGISIPKREITEAALSGILAEPAILTRWGFADGTEKGYLANYLANRQLRTCRRVNSYIVNKRFPWLFVSLDAAIEKNQSSLDGDFLTMECPLECKTMGLLVERHLEHGIPLSHVFQINQQMLVTETEYAEMALLVGGNQFKVIKFSIDYELCEAILENSRKIWHTILQLREMKVEKERLRIAAQWGLVEKITAEMESILPLPGEGDAYKEYHSERYIKTGNSYRGSMSQFKMIRKRNEMKFMVKQWESEISEIDNNFAAQFVGKQVEYFDFEGLGRVRYYKRSGGNNYQLDFKGIKEKVNADELRTLFIQHLRSFNDKK